MAFISLSRERRFLEHLLLHLLVYIFTQVTGKKRLEAHMSRKAILLITWYFYASALVPGTPGGVVFSVCLSVRPVHVTSISQGRLEGIFSDLEGRSAFLCSVCTNKVLIDLLIIQGFSKCGLQPSDGPQKHFVGPLNVYGTFLASEELVDSLVV